MTLDLLIFATQNLEGPKSQDFFIIRYYIRALRHADSLPYLSSQVLLPYVKQIVCMMVSNHLHVILIMPNAKLLLLDS